MGTVLTLTPRKEVLKKCEFRCSRDTSGSDREERPPRTALIEIGQESSAVQIHIPIPQHRRADGNRYCLLALHRNHQNGHRHTERERILASASRTEAERGFGGHLGSEVVTTSHSENTTVRLADWFEGANLRAGRWIQNLE